MNECHIRRRNEPRLYIKLFDLALSESQASSGQNCSELEFCCSVTDHKDDRKEINGIQAELLSEHNSAGQGCIAYAVTVIQASPSLCKCNLRTAVK